MKSHSEGIAMLAWSPDDTMLLSCGKEDNQEALVYSTQVHAENTNTCIETIPRVLLASGHCEHLDKVT